MKGWEDMPPNLSLGDRSPHCQKTSPLPNRGDALSTQIGYS
ncbi:hypothetical protein MiSe_20700 [Microseira wollei NIES-4236]|uniref:Uncharacterized protein n=2 Tax=Microseira wollei TaxID=467598 RepID=A0AAV3XD33_9CYAN|nr:hypothetical protein MiSe_20700 [Microseira wollei NIES-4236]